MAIIFDANEIFQLAIRIEENGEKFYHQMSEKLDDPALKELFTFLAREEVEHQKVYQEILSTFESYEPHESYPGEYFSYLRSYADNIIFSQKEFEKKMNEIDNAYSAIEFAISAELNSILYYQEVKKMVSEKNHEKIEKIINEERKHFVKLSEIKKDYNL